MATAEASVEELVGMVERGELRLPEMQRQYVWQSTRVRDLLDSLYRGYPSGAILLWETEEDVPLREMAVSQQRNPYQTTRLLLDGQQRLTSLSAVLRGEPVKVSNRVRPIELLFNLDHPDELAFVTEVDDGAGEVVDLRGEMEGESALPDEADATTDDLSRRFARMTFVVSTNKLAALPQWVKVSDVFAGLDNTAILRRAGISNFDDPRYERYTQRLAKLRAVRLYRYRMDVLERSLSYDEVTEIFVRVNSLGAKLRSSDLALAQITARWRHSLEKFQAFQAECATMGFDLDLGIHLKALIAFATGQSRFGSVGKLSLDTLQRAWGEAKAGMHFAINFLRSNVGIDGPALLSSPFLLIVVAYLGHRRGYALDAGEAARLRRWALLASAKGRFSRGSTETILDQDLASVARGEGVDALIDQVRRQFGRLDVTADDLEGKDQRSSLFKTMFLAFRAGGARDWTSNLAISLDHGGAAHRLESHHFFPKAALTKAGYTTRDADEVANLTFVAGKTNRRIADKLPGDYVPATLGDNVAAALAAQAVPADPESWDVTRYKSFLAERRDLIAAALNAFLAEPGGPDAPDPATEIGSREHGGQEFKSTLRWDLREERINKDLEQVVVKSIAGFSNADGGTLWIGVADDGSILGLDDDYRSLGGDRDKFERHLRTLIANVWGQSAALGGIAVSFPSIEGRDVCRIEVAPGKAPLFVSTLDRAGAKAERFYVRSGNASPPIDTASQIALYINRRFPGYGGS